MIRWYDYIVCFMFADVITTMLFTGSIFVFVPVLCFDFYCYIRKVEEENTK